MRLIILISFLLAISACTQSSNDSTPQATETSSGASYSAEFGIPSQSLLQPCDGIQPLVRPVLRCFKKNSSVQVNNSFCLSLDPQYMNIPSPSGQKQTTITGGLKFESCEEGSNTVITTSYSCNPGFFLKDNSCQNFSSVGNYIVQKDEIYRKSGNLQINYTVGHDFGFRTNNGLNLLMTLE